MSMTVISPMNTSFPMVTGPVAMNPASAEHNEQNAVTIQGDGHTVIFKQIAGLLARRIVNAPFGLSLMTIRRNALRASALGVPVPRVYVLAFMVSSGLAAMAGGLLLRLRAACPGRLQVLACVPVVVLRRWPSEW